MKPRLRWREVEVVRRSRKGFRKITSVTDEKLEELKKCFGLRFEFNTLKKIENQIKRKAIQGGHLPLTTKSL